VNAVIENNDVIVVGIGDKNLLEAVVTHAKPGQIVIDLVNMKNQDQLNCIYQGLCW
jgi:GDP-mannose 6-dehydrogenase